MAAATDNVVRTGLSPEFQDMYFRGILEICLNQDILDRSVGIELTKKFERG